MLVMALSNCFEVMFTRCSIRWFKQDPIPLDIVNKLIEIATRAPTAHGAEQWFFIIVYSEEKRREIHRLLKLAHKCHAEEALINPYSPEIVDKWMKRIDQGMYMAPLYIAAYIDMRKRVYREEFSECEKSMAIQSLAAAIENLIIAAWSMGIGSVWLGVPLLLREEFNKILNPPPGCELQSIIALGYPAETPKPRKRKNISEVTLVI